jgi:hypothetical protein
MAHIGQDRTVAKHFIVVLVPMKGGGWRAHFPDFPGCRAEGSRIEGTIDASYAEVTARLSQSSEVPSPRSYEDVRADDTWARARDIDWSTAVISMVRIG